MGFSLHHCLPVLICFLGLGLTWENSLTMEPSEPMMKAKGIERNEALLLSCHCYFLFILPEVQNGKMPTNGVSNGVSNGLHLHSNGFRLPESKGCIR